MLKIEDILSSGELKEYQNRWGSFRQKYTPETEYKVHSGMPVIGEIYRYKDKYIFRSHVFQRRLRKFDPYFISKRYASPYWHALHYFTVIEQMYHASANLIRDGSKLIAKDIPRESEWKRPIFWDKTPHPNISIELILKDLGTSKTHFKEKANFAFYDDKINRVLSRMSVITFWQPRSYIRSIEKIKNGGKEEIEKLIRKIEAQDLNLKRLTKPRQNLLISKDYLINKLRDGKIPEKELHDFFSFWDKEEN